MEKKHEENKEKQ